MSAKKRWAPTRRKTIGDAYEYDVLSNFSPDVASIADCAARNSSSPAAMIVVTMTTTRRRVPMITCIITGLRARPMSSCVSAQPACAMRPMMIKQKRPAAGRHGHVWPTIASRTARKKSCEKRPMWKSSSCFAAVPSLSIGNFSMKSCTIFFGITKCGTITRAPRQPMTVRTLPRGTIGGRGLAARGTSCGRRRI